jgi:hypothetical protein
MIASFVGSTALTHRDEGKPVAKGYP